MDSPENCKTTTIATTSPLPDAVATQDSGIFSYINNLSPIQPLKATPEVSGFPGLNSPPPVFTSPHLKPYRDTHFFKRSQLPTADLSQQGGRGNEIDEYMAPLADPMEVDRTRSAHSARLSLMQSEVPPQSLTDSIESNSLGQILDNETYKQLYGMHRRCLQFGESPLDTVANNRCFGDTTLPANPGWQLISLNQPTIPTSSGRNSVSSTVPKPSDIGLHLNRIINAMPHSCSTGYHQTKRLKASAADDDDGCRHCNCKKTRCLKLYCDCFSAGFYCAELCACQGCFNRPEYEDTVSDTREQTESRNPFAFSPKIVQRLTESHASRTVEDVTASTPSSARHKRGCNCKKSMCSKKYCECFQANVGCSNVCRCEGCENMYGRMEDYGMNNDVLRREHYSSFEKKLEMCTSQYGLLPTDLSNRRNMAPPPPSFQFSE